MSRRHKSQKMEQRPSLSELSALLDENNSDDGLRLADYLLKKQSNHRPMRVFGTFQPKRYSGFKIRLKKVDDMTQVAQSEQEKETEVKSQTENHYVGTEIPLEEELEKQRETESLESIVSAEGLVKKVSPPSRINPDQVAVDAGTRKSPLPVVKSPQFAILRSSIRKSGGMPSADRLRRYSFKRQSAANTSGRRKLLEEFDSIAADSNFSPNCYSTPMSQNPPLVPTSPTTPTKPTGATGPVHNDKTSISTSNVPACPFKDTAIRDTENIEQLLTSLHNHDEVLREMLEKDSATSNQNLEERNLSPSNSSMRCRTYNIEKGTQPGQVILTPTKTHSGNVLSATPNYQQQQQDVYTDQYPHPECPTEDTNVTHKKKSAPNKSILASPKVLEILHRITGKTQITTRSMSAGKSEIPSRIPLRTPSRILFRTPSSKVVPMPEIPNTPAVAAQHGDINTPAYDVEIPETQELHHSVSRLPTTNEVLHSLQGTTSPMIVVPIYQTFNQLPQTELNLGVGTENNVSKMTLSAGKQMAGEIIVSKAKVTTDTTDHRATDKTNNNIFNKSLNRTLDKTTNKTLNKSTAAKQSQKQIGTAIKTTTSIQSKNNLKNYSDVADDLRFEDIITEDEEDVPKSPTRAKKSQRNALQVTNLECSNAPLNLAPPAETCAPRHTRKRVARRQLIATDSTEIETKMWPPRAHPLTITRTRSRAQQQRRNVPLNAEPRTPINGEKFAKELKANLARLKNHEILDLRKRNSIGKVFTISGRKSLADRNDILNKQLQLENEIQFELLRRNLEGNDNGVTPLTQDDQNQNVYNMFELPPAPDGFRDCTTQYIDNDNVQQEQQQQVEEDKCYPLLSSPYNSSLIDDRSCDRVTFVRQLSRRSSTSNKSKRASRRNKKSNETEEVQKYLDVSNQITKHKLGDKSKRNLYSQSIELSPPSPRASQRFCRDVVANNVPPLHFRVDTPSSTRSPIQKSSSRSSRSINSCELQPLPPPKDFSDSDSNTGNIQDVENENNIFKKPLPPPPPPLRKRNQKLTNKKHKTVVIKEISGLVPISDSTDDSHIFKKPHTPPPKKGSKKKTIDKKQKAPIEEEQPAVYEETAEQSKNKESTTLRRSKRGHIPLKNYWSFRSTDTMPLYDYAILEKRKEEAKRARELRKNNTAASIRSDSEYMPIASSTVIKKQTRGKPKKINAIANAILGETNVTSASSEFSSASPPKRKRLTVISEPEEFDNQTRQENERQTVDVAQPNEELPHSTADKNHIAIPVDVDQLNIMFDQLKNATNIDNNAVMPSSSSSSQPNENVIKDLRVRLRRTVLNKEEVATKKLPNKKQAVSKKKLIPTKKSKGLTAAAKVISDTAPVPKQQTIDTVVSDLVITPSPNDSEVLSWLRNISFANSKPGQKHHNIFEEMRCSNTGNLVLSTLEGLEYAYYDNDPDGSLSYLRFKAHQSKPAKRAKSYQLQFLVLSGKFVFSTNKDLATFNPGALITIDSGARYSIKNITDKQAILMVLKKRTA